MRGQLSVRPEWLADDGARPAGSKSIAIRPQAIRKGCGQQKQPPGGRFGNRVCP